ncbi:MAG: eL32 family ribosomal protein [Candidatus Diapherotrites archaeon]|nr:eL32 family ribosomal protein [Candidatus Diapherotrites archaeon]
MQSDRNSEIIQGKNPEHKPVQGKTPEMKNEKFVQPKAQPKTEVKTEPKADKKVETATNVPKKTETAKPVAKETKVKKEKIKIKVERAKLTKSDVILENIKHLQRKISLPSFKGRFGMRGANRKVSSEKWQRWRKPRGININCDRQDGNLPSVGYRSPMNIRFLHPSGYQDVLVSSIGDLGKVNKELQAVRVSKTVGKRKKVQILQKAFELGIFEGLKLLLQIFHRLSK